MRQLLGLILILLLASAVVAQDRNFPAALGAGLPPLAPGLPPLQPTAPRFLPPSRVLRGGFPYVGAGYGYGYAGYVPAYAAAPPVVNTVVVLQPPSVPVPPPEPIRSSIQNLPWDLKPTANDAPAAFFVIALKNGSRLAAAAVWVQGNDLRYVDSDDENRRVALLDVDRAATKELNQARNLNLRLPPPAQ